jgi:glutamine synthetase
MASNTTAVKNVMAMIKKHDVKMIDFRFTDLPGQWQHFSIPANQFEENIFSDGLGFDGSSIRGWQSIIESDMLVLPDPATANVDPFIQMKSLSMICDIYDPLTKEPYSRDPRFIAKKATQFLENSRIADTSYFGPEAEFFILDHVAYNVNEYSSWYKVDSREGFWNTGSELEVNLGHKIRQKEGYSPVPPADSTNDIRNSMVAHLMNAGIELKRSIMKWQQADRQIDYKFCPMLQCADYLMMFKYIIKKYCTPVRKDGNIHAQADIRR